jgi:RimJ/RimL family protein N-acetyltransferase
MSPVQLVRATAQHLAALQSLILEHGPNEWNWLPVDAIERHANDIAEERAHAVVALDCGHLVGTVTFCVTQNFARLQSPEGRDAWHGYVCEAVVHRDYTGRGLGSELLSRALLELESMGMREVYIDRHEENLASAAMMRKAGFELIETYADPARRPHGSGRTSTCRWQFTSG